MEGEHEVELEAVEIQAADDGEPQTREVLLKAHLSDEGGTSTQRPAAKENPFADKIIEPPVDLYQLAKLTTISSTRASCIDAIARNTVGLGYSVQPGEGHEHDFEDLAATQGKVYERLDDLALRDDRSGNPSFTELLYKVKYDEEEVGNGALEVARDKRSGEISGLFHAPGKAARKLKKGGYVLLGSNWNASDSVEFYEFGDKVKYKRGKPTGELRAGRGWERNELLTFRLYTSESRDYGLPRDDALVFEYLGDKLAVQSNVSFFDSSGTPPTVLFVQGEEQKDGKRIRFTVPRETSNRIAATLKADAGHQKRVAIIPVPPGTQVKDVKLGETSDRDMGFTQFRSDNRSRTLGAFRLGAIFVPGAENSGRYTAEVERAITQEQVFGPEQDRWQMRLQHMLLGELGYEKLVLRFKKMAIESDQARRDSVDHMAEQGTVTRREHRAANGYGPLPEAAGADVEIDWNGRQYKSAEPEPGQVPFGWNDELISGKPPPGAENRSITDNRGLDAGIGAREQRSTDEELETQRQESHLQVVKAAADEADRIGRVYQAFLDHDAERTALLVKAMTHLASGNGDGLGLPAELLKALTDGVAALAEREPTVVEVKPTVTVEAPPAPNVVVQSPPRPSGFEVTRDADGKASGVKVTKED